MNAWQIGLVAWIALGSLITIVTIGQPRKPVTPPMAAVILLFNAAFIYVAVRA